MAYLDRTERIALAPASGGLGADRLLLHARELDQPNVDYLACATPHDWATEQAGPGSKRLP